MVLLRTPQPLNAYFRPHPGPTARRKVWERLHKGVGYVAIVCGAANACLGLYVASVTGFEAALWGSGAVALAVVLALQLLWAGRMECSGKAGSTMSRSSGSPGAGASLLELGQETLHGGPPGTAVADVPLEASLVGVGASTPSAHS